MNGAETGSRRGEAGRAAAMNSAEQTVTWLITLGVLESPKKTISDPEGFLQASLKDGVVLCRLLERLLPGTIEKVSAAPARGPSADAPGSWAPALEACAPSCASRGLGCAGSLAPALVAARAGEREARRSPRASFVRGPGNGGRVGGAETGGGSSGRHCARRGLGRGPGARSRGASGVAGAKGNARLGATAP